MDLRPKTEPGSPPGFSSGDHSHRRNLNEMSVSELVSVLRTAFRMDDFDRVEEVLVARDARLDAEIEGKMKEIRSLQEKIEVERMDRITVEEELKKRDEQFQKGKRAQESYETLLKEVKRSGFNDKNTIEELRNKNRELELENRNLEELKQKWLDDSNAVAELRIRNRKLEDEKLELEAGKNNWLDDKNALAALRIRNSELEKNLEDDKNTIDELRSENRKLADEKHTAEALAKSSERKFWELNERVLRLEDDTKLLMRDGPSGGNTEDKEMNEMDVHGRHADSAPLQTSEDTRHSFGAGAVQLPSKANKDAPRASAKGGLGLENVIEIEDSDDDSLHGKKGTARIVAKNEHPSSSRAVQQKKLSTTGVQSIDMLKRKLAFSDSDTSSSSSDSLNVDSLPIGSLGITSNKKSKTVTES